MTLRSLPVRVAGRVLKAILPGGVRRRLLELAAIRGVVGNAGLAHEIYDLVSFWRSAVQSIDYKGFQLFYGRGSMILFRIRDGRTWEPEIARRIAEELAAHADPVFVDAGAYIGLMTLNVLSAVPDAHVFAFEPGPYQYSLLARTVGANGLDGRVVHYPVALGDTVGKQPFAVHRRRYGALDGFVDTGRAALETIIEVEQQTLDEWWHRAGCPPVGVIKIDTEGAELWVLAGGAELLARRRPLVFLEIHPVNLAGYPHGPGDLLDWLHAHGYQLETLNGTPVSRLSLPDLLEVQEDFVARPTSA